LLKRIDDQNKIRELQKSVLNTYLNSRAVVGFTAFFLPILMLTISAISKTAVLPSISAYYHMPEAKHWFVAALLIISVFNLSYSGYKGEALWFRIIGVSAFLVAFLPTVDATGKSDVPAWMATLHFLSATTVMLGMAYVSLKLFPKNTGISGLSPEYERQDAIVYRLCGITILIALAIYGVCKLILILFLNNASEGILLFIIEVVCIWAFGIAWIRKSHYLHRTIGLFPYLPSVNTYPSPHEVND
jgi:hypothetical protein